MAETAVPESAASMIEESYEEEFQDEAPILDYLIDAKAVEAGSRRRQERELVKKVAVLEKELADSRRASRMQEEGNEAEGIIGNENGAENEDNAGNGASAEDETDGAKTYDVILRVKPEKASQITSQVIGGRKCLVIPLDENEHAAINGVNTTV